MREYWKKDVSQVARIVFPLQNIEVCISYQGVMMMMNRLCSI